MMNDPTLSDNVQNNRGEQYDVQPYYEYASPIPHQGTKSPQPVPPSPWSTPNYAGMTPRVQGQMAVPPPSGPPQPPSIPPAYWSAQGAMPPPIYGPPGPTRPSKRRWWIFGIVGAVCAIAIILAGSYVLFANLVQPSRRGTLQPVATAQPTPNSTFHSTVCPFKPGDGITQGKELTCGFLTVPEDRGNAHSSTIQLAVAIFKPSATVPPDPTVYLSGGPGGALLNGWASSISTSTINQMTQGHTLIMFDQRGTGYSQPSLKCNEITQFNSDTQNQILSRADETARYVAAGKKCHDRLVNSGVNLQAYTSIADANDVHDLIHALGYQQVNLYGVSYGTRLALTVMRLFPSDIRSVILDSTVPTQINIFSTLPAVTQHAYNTLFQGCAASPQCHDMYPQLESVFYQLVNNLNAKPVTIQDVQYGAVALNGDGLAGWVFSMLYVTEGIPLLPRAIMETSQGNYALISQFYGLLMFRDDISYGMYYSVECGEDVAFTTAQDLPKATANVHPEIKPELDTSLQSDFGVCQLWGDQPVPTAQKQPVTSSLPTLILSGEYDPITPASNAELALQTLSHGYLFRFPGTGHGVFTTNICPDRIVATFLQRPTTKPDGSCIAAMSEPNFV